VEELRRSLADDRGMAAKIQREGTVLQGWLENELREAGVDDKKAREIAKTARDYLGR